MVARKEPKSVPKAKAAAKTKSKANTKSKAKTNSNPVLRLRRPVSS